MRHLFRVSHRSSAKPSFASKTKLAALPSWLLACNLVLFFLTIIILTRPTHAPADNCGGANIDGSCVVLARAETKATRAIGLSGRDTLDPKTGMLFVFGQPTTQCIWMKDMRFAIDITWLDEDRRVIKIMEAVEPSTYPESFCAENIKYVLELNANEARILGLAVGQQIDL